MGGVGVGWWVGVWELCCGRCWVSKLWPDRWPLCRLTPWATLTRCRPHRLHTVPPTQTTHDAAHTNYFLFPCLLLAMHILSRPSPLTPPGTVGNALHEVARTATRRWQRQPRGQTRKNSNSASGGASGIHGSSEDGEGAGSKGLGSGVDYDYRGGGQYTPSSAESGGGGGGREGGHSSEGHTRHAHTLSPQLGGAGGPGGHNTRSSTVASGSISSFGKGGGGSVAGTGIR